MSSLNVQLHLLHLDKKLYKWKPLRTMTFQVHAYRCVMLPYAHLQIWGCGGSQNYRT